MIRHINVASVIDFTVKEFTQTIKEVFGFKRGIYFEPCKPDRTFRKFLDSKVINNFDFKSKISLWADKKNYQNFVKINGNF
jgi:nucleoside-diphosphate-sugar epimerase